MINNKVIKTRVIKNVNGINIKILETKVKKKQSNTIILLHGFPELSYSFRHLMLQLGQSGFYCVAPDQRGYSSIEERNNKLTSFSVLNLAKDILSLKNKLDIENFHLIGHDFGSYVSAYFCLLYPQWLLSITLMSMPFGGPLEKKDINKLKLLNKQLAKLRPKRKHYQYYFSSKSASINIMRCKQGMSDFLRGYFYFKSYDYHLNKPYKLSKLNAIEMSQMPEYYIMRYNLGISQTVEKYMPTRKQIKECKWLSEKDLKIFVNNFKKNGISNPLKWYKAMLSKKEQKKIVRLKLPKTTNIPAKFISGISDWGMYQKPGEIEKMENTFFRNFYGTSIIKNAGHWVQQEQPVLTFNEIMKFYRYL